MPHMLLEHDKVPSSGKQCRGGCEHISICIFESESSVYLLGTGFLHPSSAKLVAQWHLLSKCSSRLRSNGANFSKMLTLQPFIRGTISDEVSTRMSLVAVVSLALTDHQGRFSVKGPINFFQLCDISSVNHVCAGCTVLVGLLASSRRSFRSIWAVPVIAAYPLSIFAVYWLDKNLGWQ